MATGTIMVNIMAIIVSSGAHNRILYLSGYDHNGSLVHNCMLLKFLREQMALLWQFCYSQEKFLDFLYTTEISAILADFCLSFVAMATPFDLLKILIVHLNSPTPKTLLLTPKIYQYFIQN